MIFIGVRKDLGIKPSHPRAQSRPLTLRTAIHDLPATQDESIDHVWIDEWKIRTKWIRRVPYIKPGQKVRPKSQHVRLDWDKPCRTVTRNGGIQCYVGNSDIHPSQHRTLSIREMARVSSFPDQFRFIDPRKEGHNRVGNCVPPLFMAAIASHIKENVL